MHERYDKEIHCGGDQPDFVISPNKKALGISSDGKHALKTNGLFNSVINYYI